MKIIELYDLFLHDKIYEGKTQGTQDQYNLTVKKLFIERYLVPLKILDIDDLNLYIAKGFVVKLRSEDTRSINTIQSYWRHIRIFLNWLYENEYTEIDFQRKTKNVKGYKVLKEIYTDDEIYYMFANIKGKSFLACRRRAILALLLGTGIRQGELCSLTLDGLYLEQNYIVVHGHKSRSDRRLPISFPLKVILMDYVNKRVTPVNAANKNILFYTRGLTGLKTSGLRSIVTGITKKIGITRGNTHLFRHTFGTRMALETDNVFYVQQLLGHKDLQTTKAYYHDAEQYRVAAVKFDTINNILARINRR